MMENENFIPPLKKQKIENGENSRDNERNNGCELNEVPAIVDAGNDKIKQEKCDNG